MQHVRGACLHVHGQLRDMVSNAMSWARSRGLIRTNEVHGKEEFRVPTASLYSFTEVQGNKSEASGTIEVEDNEGNLLNMDLSAETAMRQQLFCNSSVGA